jgi:hypothetical protein
MQLLIKRRQPSGPGAHIADRDGRPLCKIPLRLVEWKIIEDDPKRHLMCGRCQEALNQQDGKHSTPVT